MDELRYAKFERLMLKSHSQLNENWVQEHIAEDPSILGLGDLILKDKERAQPHAGRLDLLLQDSDGAQRFEVEIQLGRTDESHIIRTIEYWDIERRRYPQYDHTAVIVAEDITSRFLNVIGLFNGFIPLVAIQMSALKHGESVSLVFTKVLDQMTLGLVEDEEEAEVTDRSYWEKRGTPETVALADQMLELIHTFAPDVELKYNKFYIGLAVGGRTKNFTIFRPLKSSLRSEFRMSKSDEIQQRIEEAGLDLIDYSKWGRYRVRLGVNDISQHRDVLLEVLRRSYEDGES